MQRGRALKTIEAGRPTWSCTIPALGHYLWTCNCSLAAVIFWTFHQPQPKPSPNTPTSTSLRLEYPFLALLLVNPTDPSHSYSGIAFSVPCSLVEFIISSFMMPLYLISQ